MLYQCTSCERATELFEEDDYELDETICYKQLGSRVNGIATNLSENITLL